ncbi:Conserved_hypothetical protein [Hexamita inflata]|uniref:Uncharacterized protein n=1 Tax=Hexamita inflata TaxID=28002 RepID=A0AA86U052_9EUKA|nr:Conserved hypothetical protein [Hexamita inflata]
MNILIQVITMELSRAEKIMMYNCYSTQTDINMFQDSGNLLISIISTKQEKCKIPHGVLISLQIDSLGVYEPQIYLVDYDYNNTTQFTVLCDDPACQNLNEAKAAVVIIETKTHVTYVKVGSISLAKGLATNCFHDNESKIELLFGAIVVDFYPTYSCLNSIVIQKEGQLIMKTPNNARVYIIYSDNSVSVHDPVTVDVQNATFIPTRTVSSSSPTVRVKLSKAYISDYFIPIQNGTITKAVKEMLVHLQFSTDLILIKTTQTIINYFKFVGIENAYSYASIQLIHGGFVTRKVASSQLPHYNNILMSQGVTSYASEYIFTLHDVAKTNDLWFRLIGNGFQNYLLNENPTQSTCAVRFPNQQCEKLEEKLQKYQLNELNVQINFYYYKNQTLVNNYTVTIRDITDSCFSGGYVYVDGRNITIFVIGNNNCRFCQLETNDLVQVEIAYGNNTIIKQLLIDYVHGEQKYVVGDVDVEHMPEIRVQFFKDSELRDAISIHTYKYHKPGDVQKQSILILIYILTTNLMITITYVLWILFIYPRFEKCLQRHKSNQNKAPKMYYEQFIEFE